MFSHTVEKHDFCNFYSSSEQMLNSCQTWTLFNNNNNNNMNTTNRKYSSTAFIWAGHTFRFRWTVGDLEDFGLVKFSFGIERIQVWLGVYCGKHNPWMIVRSKEYFPLNSCSDLCAVTFWLLVILGHLGNVEMIAVLHVLLNMVKEPQKKTRNKHFYELRYTRATFHSVLKRL